MWWTQTTAPDGWLICDGSQISRTTYSDLFSVIGTTFGSGDGSTTFTLPDLRAAFVRGAGSQNGHTATFGGKQQATGLTIASDTSGTSSISIISYDDLDANSGNAKSGIFQVSSTRAYLYRVRPYNIALTPVIKY